MNYLKPIYAATTVLAILMITGCAVLQDRKAAVAFAYAGTAAHFSAHPLG